MTLRYRTITVVDERTDDEVYDECRWLHGMLRGALNEQERRDVDRLVELGLADWTYRHAVLAVMGLASVHIFDRAPHGCTEIEDAEVS